MSEFDFDAALKEALVGVDLTTGDKKIARNNLIRLDNQISRLETEIEFLKLGAEEEHLSRLLSLDANTK